MRQTFKNGCACDASLKMDESGASSTSLILQNTSSSRSSDLNCDRKLSLLCSSLGYRNTGSDSTECALCLALAQNSAISSFAIEQETGSASASAVHDVDVEEVVVVLVGIVDGVAVSSNMFGFESHGEWLFSCVSVRVTGVEMLTGMRLDSVVDDAKEEEVDAELQDFVEFGALCLDPDE